MEFDFNKSTEMKKSTFRKWVSAFGMLWFVLGLTQVFTQTGIHWVLGSLLCFAIAMVFFLIRFGIVQFREIKEEEDS